MENPVSPQNIQNTVNNAGSAVNQAVNQAVAQPVQQAEKKLPRFFKRKPLLISAILFIVLIAVIAVVSLNSGKPQTPQQTDQDVVLATVAGEKIYKSEVEQEAHKQYEKSAINEEVINIYLDSLIEQRILSYSASQVGIKVEASESAKRAQDMVGSSNTEVTPVLLTAARYDLLKEKIMSQFVSSRTVTMVGYWTPSDDYIQAEGLTQEKADLAKRQQAQARTALLQVATLIRRGVEPLEATKTVMEDEGFADLAKIIAVNGYIVSKSKDDPVIKTPRVYTSSEQSGVEKYFYDAIFSMKKDEIRSILNPDGSSGYVIKILEAKDGQFKSYNEWFLAQFKKLVVLHR